MYIVRETYIARPGHAGEFANLMKEEMKQWPDFKGYVLLDAVTDYNTVVVQYEIENLTEFGKMMDEHQAAKEKKAREGKKDATPPPYTQLYQTGKREIFRVV